MKAWMLLCFVPSLALAEPRIETIDRGDAVEVIAHDITAANTTITPVRSRLEIAVTGKPAPINTPSTDPTIVISELDNRVLSVKTAFDRAEVKSLAPHAKAMQIGADLHILIPRKIPAAGTAIELPEPTLTDVPKVVKIEMPEPPKAEAPKAEPNLATAPPAPVDAKPEPAKQAAPPLPTKAASPTNPMSKTGMLGMMALVAVGCGMWLMKRKKKQQGPTSSIEVIAQHSLGSKAKVVWIAAGSREMVIAVTAQGVRMLGQWKKTEGAATEGAAAQFATYTENGNRTRLPTAQVVEPVVDRTSPAVAGLLKLRASTVRPEPRHEPIVDDDVATGDIEADALWAKEILMATRASTHRGTR